MMAACCREALSYGSSPLPVAAENYHVTVILNPSASGGNGRKLFEKYSAPLLHLAGFKVSVQLTSGREEAKELMKIMGNTDAVLIAGGDGTLMEAVTGLMRRDDVGTFCQVPIGIIPVGEANNFSKRLFPNDNPVRGMAEATMAVIKQLKKPVSVIQVENLAEQEEYFGNKIYGLSELEFGSFREAYNRRDKYWMFVGLKDVLSYVFGYSTAHKDITWEWPLNLNWTTTHKVTRQEEERVRGIAGIFSSPKMVEKTEEVEEWQEEGVVDTVSQLELTIKENEKSLETKIYPANLSFSEFVGHGAARIKGEESDVKPQVFSSKQFSIDTPVNEEMPRNMSVDGEEIELLGPMRVSLIPDQLLFFCKPEDSVTQKVEDSTASKRWSTVTSNLMPASTGRNRL